MRPAGGGVRMGNADSAEGGIVRAKVRLSLGIRWFGTRLLSERRASGQAGMAAEILETAK
jgi:hypothetical protein